MKRGWNDKKLAELQISSSTVKKLSQASVGTVQDLVALSEREVQAIQGIGAKSLLEIQAALNSLGLELAEDPYGKLLFARHGKKRTDTRLRSYFLCEQCGNGFRTLALNNTAPAFMMRMTDGPFYCSHCNKTKTLYLHQWLVCDICDRVLRSIGRGIEANKSVLEWWEKQRANDLSLPRLVETDPPNLRPFGDRGNASSLDLTAKIGAVTTPFGVELKTEEIIFRGGNIGSGMTQFQLDVNDIQSVLEDIQNADSFIPAYVFHCQVVDVPKPPTTKFECVGIWWVSIKDLIGNIVEIRQRFRENRPAAYIATFVFKQITSFIDEVRSKVILVAHHLQR